MSISETVEYCCKVLMMWAMDEIDNPSMEYNERDKEFIENSFISKVLLKKFEVFDIKIHLPAPLLIILSLCTNENPGQVQIILKKLLLDIKERKGAIPEGYVITSEDFGLCFQESFPITSIPIISEAYEVLWSEQKRTPKHPLESDNLCDTIEWWKEVME